MEKQYCTFFINSLLFGIKVQEVQEIVSQYRVSSAPLAPSTVAGLVNHRGQIVTAIDMHIRLDLPGGDDIQRFMLIVRGKDETFGLLVDRIGDVLSVNSRDFETIPENMQANARDLVEGAYKLPDRLLLPLNLDKIAEVRQ